MSVARCFLGEPADRRSHPTSLVVALDARRRQRDGVGQRLGQFLRDRPSQRAEVQARVHRDPERQVEKALSPRKREIARQALMKTSWAQVVRVLVVVTYR